MLRVRDDVFCLQTFRNFTEKARQMIPLFLNQLRTFDPQVRVSISQFCDHPSTGASPNSCFLGISPLSTDIDEVVRKMSNIQAECNGGRDDPEDSLRAAGYVAKRYAGYTEPSNESVLRTLIIATDRDPHSGEYQSDFDTDALLCDHSVGNQHIPSVGQIMRHAQIFPIFLIAGNNKLILERWRFQWPEQLGYQEGEYLTLNFDINTDVPGLVTQLYTITTAFACIAQDQPSFDDSFVGEASQNYYGSDEESEEKKAEEEIVEEAIQEELRARAIRLSVLIGGIISGILGAALLALLPYFAIRWARSYEQPPIFEPLPRDSVLEENQESQASQAN